MSRLSLRGVVSIAFLSLLFTSCIKEKSVELNLPSVPSSGGSAVFDLNVSGGNCMNAAILGTYKVGTATNSTNKVDIEVSVNTIGTWTMNSAAITGFYFSGSGTFASTGTQIISLNASGTPTTAGTQTFTLLTGSTSCTFAVAVDSANTGGGGGGGGTGTGEYFPMTQASWWSYDDPFAPGDTLKRTINGTQVFGGNTYKKFDEADNSGTVTSSYFFRKDASNNYYEYTDADFYTFALTFDNPQKGDILFLKSSLTSGATWNSAEFTGAVSGISSKLRYAYTCTGVNATGTINGKSFTNVSKVTFKPQISIMGSPFTDEGGVWETWFAKDIGLIYMKGTFGSLSYEMKIRNWNVL